MKVEMNPPLEFDVTGDDRRTFEGYNNRRDRSKSITCNSYRGTGTTVPEVGLSEMVGPDVENLVLQLSSTL